jgi:tetrapyrrole methylase family protein/MazG family protein
VRTVSWADLDRDVEPDHLTSLYVPVLAAPVGAELVRFGELVQLLRRECPWDREQTHQSLVRHVLEEAQEVADAIDALGDDPEATEAAAIDHLEEELGDLLLQVYLHATLAAEQGWFTLADVARGIHEKLVERHPHVFGDEVAETIDDVRAIWYRVKAARSTDS